MQIDERIPGMSDQELENLRNNATRLAKSGAPKQQAEAERLLPIISAAIAARGVARAAERAARPKPLRKTRAKAAKPEAESSPDAD